MTKLIEAMNRLKLTERKLGSKIEKVTVADGESKTVDFKFTAPGGN